MRFYGWVLLAVTLLRGQEVPWVRTELKVLAVGEALEGFRVQQGEGFSELNAGLVGLGPPVAYYGPARLLLWPPAEEGVEAVPVADVDLPAGARRVLLLCLQGEDQRLRLIALDISGSRMAGGDYFFLNVSSQAVGVMLGGESVALQPGQTRMLRHRDWRSGAADLTIRVGQLRGEESRLVFSSIWGHHPDRRNYVLVMDGPHASMPVVLRKVHDRMPPEE